MVADRFAASSFHGPFVDIDATPVNVVDAVLAALFDACEVRDEWGVHNTWPDGRSETYWRGPRLYADAVIRAQLRLGSTVEREVVHRCVLSTPPESEIDT
jgi:hypothetical protein